MSDRWFILGSIPNAADLMVVFYSYNKGRLQTLPRAHYSQHQHTVHKQEQDINLERKSRPNRESVDE